MAGGLWTPTKVSSAASNYDGNPNGPGDYQGVAVANGTTYPYFSDHRAANAAGDDTAGTIDGGFEIYAGVVP